MTCGRKYFLKFAAIAAEAREMVRRASPLKEGDYGSVLAQASRFDSARGGRSHARVLFALRLSRGGGRAGREDAKHVDRLDADIRRRIIGQQLLDGRFQAA